MNTEWSFDDHQSIIKFKQEFRNRHKNHVRITIWITSPHQIGQRWNQYSAKFYLFAQTHFRIIHIICSFPWFDCFSKLNANLLTIWPNLIKHQQQQFVVVGKFEFSDKIDFMATMKCWWWWAGDSSGWASVMKFHLWSPPPSKLLEVDKSKRWELSFIAEK